VWVLGGGGGGRVGARQMHKLDMSILNRPKEEEGSTSGTQGDVERWQAQWGSDGRDVGRGRSRAGSEQGEKKDSGASGV
jgi:hypothetical protein